MIEVQLEVSAARSRADRIRRGLVSFANMQQDLADAWNSRDDKTLGYGSWEAYIKAEFGQSLPRAEQRELHVSLAAIGMSDGAIADATGVSRQTVLRDRQRVQDGQVESDREERKVTGRDGRIRKMPVKRHEPEPTPDEKAWAEEVEKPFLEREPEATSIPLPTVDTGTEGAELEHWLVVNRLIDQLNRPRLTVRNELRTELITPAGRDKIAHAARELRPLLDWLESLPLMESSIWDEELKNL